jgi:large repetitive protein
VSDGHGGTDAATVSVTVTPSNDPPKAVDDSVTTKRKRSVTIAVLRNDSDPDGDPVRVVSVGDFTNGGKARINKDRTVTYKPSKKFAGTETFRYTIIDGQGGTDTATVTVTVR